MPVHAKAYDAEADVIARLMAVRDEMLVLRDQTFAAWESAYARHQSLTDEAAQTADAITQAQSRVTQAEDNLAFGATFGDFQLGQSLDQRIAAYDADNRALADLLEAAADQSRELEHLSAETNRLKAVHDELDDRFNRMISAIAAVWYRRPDLLPKARKMTTTELDTLLADANQLLADWQRLLGDVNAVASGSKTAAPRHRVKAPGGDASAAVAAAISDIESQLEFLNAARPAVDRFAAIKEAYYADQTGDVELVQKLEAELDALAPAIREFETDLDALAEAIASLDAAAQDLSLNYDTRHRELTALAYEDVDAFLDEMNDWLGDNETGGTAA